MPIHCRTPRDTIRWPTWFSCLVILTACTESAGVVLTPDWQSRIGHYSLDDATRELGPPESCVELDGGGSACSWTTSKGKEWIDRLVLTFDLRKRLASANNVRL